MRDAHYPWYRGLFVRRTLTELRDVMRKMLDLYPLLLPGAVFNESKKLWAFPSGGTLQMSYCETYKDATAHQGAEYTWLGLDEIGLMADEMTYTFLVSRVRSTHPEAQQHLRVRASANPAGTGHQWLKRRFVDPTKKGQRIYTYTTESGITRTRAFIPGRLSENPYLPPEYISQLDELPELLRRAIRDGDWDVGVSSAFSDLDREVHLVPPFPVPEGWQQWAGHDWGFSHNAPTVWLAKGFTGELYVMDTVWCRRLLPSQIAERVWETLPVPELSITYAGPDCWAEHRARSQEGATPPTIADQYIATGWAVTQASTARVQGYQHLLDLLSWRGRGPGDRDLEPRLRFCDTPGNRRLFNELEGLMVDPDDPRDVLKTDADPVTGVGGDDGYDALRYAVASHQPAAREPVPEVTAWQPEILALQAERDRRRITTPAPKSRERADNLWEVS